MKKDKAVEEYIEKQASPNKGILQKLRKIIWKTLPECGEEMKWGVPVFSKGKFYLVSLKGHVNVGFSVKGLSGEELKLFEGKGKTMRHIKIRTAKEIDEKKISKLLKLVDRKASCEGC